MRILLVGYGKMGKMIESLAGEFGGEVAGMIDPQSASGKDGPESDRWSGVDVAIDFSTPDSVVSVIVPEFVVHRWWHQFLHNQTALGIKYALIFEPGIVVTSVPFHLD